MKRKWYAAELRRCLPVVLVLVPPCSGIPAASAEPVAVQTQGTEIAEAAPAEPAGGVPSSSSPDGSPQGLRITAGGWLLAGLLAGTGSTFDTFEYGSTYSGDPPGNSDIGVGIEVGIGVPLTGRISAVTRVGWGRLRDKEGSISYSHKFDFWDEYAAITDQSALLWQIGLRGAVWESSRTHPYLEGGYALTRHRRKVTEKIVYHDIWGHGPTTKETSRTVTELHLLGAYGSIGVEHELSDHVGLDFSIRGQLGRHDPASGNNQQPLEGRTDANVTVTIGLAFGRM